MWLATHYQASDVQIAPHRNRTLLSIRGARQRPRVRHDAAVEAHPAHGRPRVAGVSGLHGSGQLGNWATDIESGSKFGPTQAIAWSLFA